jgi:hypothetical protein
VEGKGVETPYVPIGNVHNREHDGTMSLAGTLMPGPKGQLLRGLVASGGLMVRLQGCDALL